jgi:hypothetical protein
VSKARRSLFRLFSIKDAATTVLATTAMKMVHIALISGFTPSRTSE